MSHLCRLVYLDLLCGRYLMLHNGIPWLYAPGHYSCGWPLKFDLDPAFAFYRRWCI